MNQYEINQANDCKSGAICIIDYYCENPSRYCYTCRRTKSCHLAVKLAHDALVGKSGLHDDLDHTKWHQLMSWKTEYDKLRGV